MITVDQKVLDIGWENCQLLKTEGSILLQVPSYKSILFREVVIKMKGSEGMVEVTPVFRAL